MEARKRTYSGAYAACVIHFERRQLAGQPLRAVGTITSRVTTTRVWLGGTGADFAACSARDQDVDATCDDDITTTTTYNDILKGGRTNTGLHSFTNQPYPPSSSSRKHMAEFARRSKAFSFAPRQGTPGRVWTSRRAEWLSSLSDSDVFVRSPLAMEFGMRTCLAVPVQFGGHVNSVMAFFSPRARPFDADTDALASLLAKCLEDVYSPNLFS